MGSLHRHHPLSHGYCLLLSPDEDNGSRPPTELFYDAGLKIPTLLGSQRSPSNDKLLSTGLPNEILNRHSHYRRPSLSDCCKSHATLYSRELLSLELYLTHPRAEKAGENEPTDRNPGFQPEIKQATTNYFLRGHRKNLYPVLDPIALTPNPSLCKLN